MNNSIKRISDIVPGIVKKAKYRSKKNRSLKQRWKELVDEDTYVHTEVEYIKDNTLIVKVDSATWLHYISAFKKEEIIKVFQENYRDKFISDIRFYVGILEKKV